MQSAECRMQSDNPSVNLAVDSSLYTREPKSKSFSAYTVKVKVKIKILLPYYGSKLNKPPLCKGRWQTSLATGDGGIVKVKICTKTIPLAASLTAPFTQGSLRL